MARLYAIDGQQDDGRNRSGTAPIGQILTDQGAIDEADLDRALLQQRIHGRRLGEVLRANGVISERALQQAVARQWSLGTVDLATDPIDPDLIRHHDLDAYLTHRILPWRALGGVVSYAVVDPGEAQQGLAALRASGPFAFFNVITPSDFERAVAQHLGPDLADRAATRTPKPMSVRSLGRVRLIAAAALSTVLALVLVGGAEVAVLGLLLLFLLNACTTVLRILALIAGGAAPYEAGAPSGTIDLARKRAPPKITLLLPLYREAEMVPRLLAALGRIDYPRELTEVVLLLEANDDKTFEAVTKADLPGWIRPLVVPPGAPRTKPRALNYALDFCDGEIIGILDAEDRPAPDQLSRVAEIMRAAPPEVACVQCQLSYFNARDNWISRCFQIEYSIWFAVLLRGFQALRLPIPLGGTSVYFRTSALKSIGAWDAHNVTEDADLGMRLSRAGMRTAVDMSVTEEEANCRALPWIRQRSRWLKGYLLTWLSHMRRPARAWRDLGPRSFFAMNILFLGAAATYLAMPLFWIAIIGWMLGAEAPWGQAMPGWAIWPALASLAIGQIVMLGCAALALMRRGMLGLLIWVPTLPIYWTLGAIAAWKAVIELFVAPFYWDKTRHGISAAPKDCGQA